MKSLLVMLVASLTIGSFASRASADTTTTVETTTTSYSLPTDSTYIVVDPLSGTVRGTFDPVTRLLNGQPVPSGYYVVDQPTGKVLATVDSSGNLISFTSIPVTLPQHFVVIHGHVVYFESDYALRRAQLEERIDAEYAAGRLSNDHVKELKEHLSEITNLETKRKSNGNLKESTRKEIERKFARVQSDLDKDVAHINEKRAKIGIRVD